METLRSVSIGLAFAAICCASSAVWDASAGAFDGGSAATVLCACFLGGFAAVGLLATRGGDQDVR